MLKVCPRSPRMGEYGAIAGDPIFYEVHLLALSTVTGGVEGGITFNCMATLKCILLLGCEERVL